MADEVGLFSVHVDVFLEIILLSFQEEKSFVNETTKYLTG